MFEQRFCKTANPAVTRVFKFPWKGLGLLGLGGLIGGVGASAYLKSRMPDIFRQQIYSSLQEAVPGLIMGGLLGAGIGSMVNRDSPGTGLLLGGILGSALGGGLQYISSRK